MIALDLNNPEFQANLLALQKDEAWAVFKTLRLLQTMDWRQLVLSKGLLWELIQSRQGPQGQRLYSLWVSRSCRAVARRDSATAMSEPVAVGGVSERSERCRPPQQARYSTVTLLARFLG